MASAKRTFHRALHAGLFAVFAAAAAPLLAAPCSFEAQGEGHVAEVIDGRSFRLGDGREIKLAGIELVSSDATRAERAAALSAVIAGKDVTLRGADDAPDRYGRQTAFVFLAGSDTPVQSLLLAEGAALGFPRNRRQGVRRRFIGGRGRRKSRKKGRMEQPHRHKKRGKYRRYFGRDWAFFAGRGQGFVRTTSRGNNLSELRTALDTGLRCDYFKAQHAGGRIRRRCA